MDTGALARGILAALSDPAAAAARAKLAQERYVARFDFGTMVDRTEAVYAELLGAHVEAGGEKLSARTQLACSRDLQ
jgi:glycosyltransferase involved in cell wall biosynthesis